ncbi:MAG TPA: dihydrolipoyl dehydrogenase [Candidatus Deferrimicrobiaceae bacterium]|nr:dihydrolipoyl dehydrogenase [Candidatus Deferrimicrobiaceae bacterium]
MRKFDLVVIGAGPGGYVAAIRAAQLGLKVAVVERDRPGGVCVNWGCIPSKSILKSADLYQQMKNAAAYGIVVKGLSVDYREVIRRSRKVAERMSKGVGFLFRKNGIELVAANAVVSSPTTVKAGDEEIGAGAILVAVGTAVRGLPGIEPDGKTVLTSDDALAQEEMPGSVVVLGGGAVGVEFAYIYRTFGAEVTIVEMEDQLLPRTDREVARELEKSFRKQGIRVLTSAPAKALDKAAGTLTVTREGKEEKVSAGKFLVAVGRKPLTEGLGLEACGVRLEKGYVQVDASLRTSCPTIYAIGDVIGGMLLAHEASAEGVAAAEIIAGRETRPPDRDRIPACIFCQPEVATVGLSEEEAKRRGIAVKVSKFPFTALGRAVASGHTEGFVKMVAEERYGEVIGCHIIGHGASDLIAELGLARTLEATFHEIGRTVHAHPTLPEAIREAALMLGGEAIDI